MNPTDDSLLAPMPGAQRREIGGVQVDVVRTGEARVKRVVYPVGFRWSKNMQPVVGTPLCMHAHVGFLARGSFHIQYADGAVEVFRAPQVVAIEPGHDGWVEGDEPAVLIEFDFEGDTVQRLGIPEIHQQARPAAS
ncbi:hypothetical protein F0P96_16950 [Hymenobacter busanensis]|uniref:Uncharacterized protein n=1 Tax=Hymenobacter busanensis TaxID=2607656 RepID=A0A7L4ZT73_9BACT|nr:hypothetical protein [Hymenobacter busanensis]KAA9327665.1 hypothetical protein F0P96_16950 [Hymenobacter busanensis]QHJ05995.1 hypothetical protein GUY19_01280 [Hymenobacter busanensis]